MPPSNRRDFLRALATTAGASAAFSLLSPAIQRALAIPPYRQQGSLDDVQHVVILMQENRSFDHYFGTLRGVRGFGDRFPIPLPDRPGVEGKNVWYQSNGPAGESSRVVPPFRLNTEQTFELMRVHGTPHTWPDAQYAWAEGVMNAWPQHKHDHSLGYYTRADIPFQFALAEAFTVCDAYHCSFQGGTNPNRVFAWSGHNDPLQQAGGPVLYNKYDNVDYDPDGGYRWTTYCERLQTAGIRWQVYQNMADNFTDNPLAGFAAYRRAARGLPSALSALRERGMSTRDLDAFEEDVLAGVLPQVSWIIATAEGSEHPGPSSPAQGAEYTARVLDALTANPEVWSKTVLFVMFDENDGFFDHVPPPAAPSYERYHEDPAQCVLAGASTVDTRGEYHEFGPLEHSREESAPWHRPYGLGPRVPLYVVSPWSKGGWVNSQVSDHTSLIRFLERRFGVSEPNISPWRRAVCGDLTSALDFRAPQKDSFYDDLPDTSALSARARAIAEQPTPATPATTAALTMPVQEAGVRPSRALPYALSVTAQVEPERSALRLSFENLGRAGAVFHVYDRHHLERLPRRYTVEAGKQLVGEWALHDSAAQYDLWVLGPNGFHRHFVGEAQARTANSPASLPPPELHIGYDSLGGNLSLALHNPSARPCTFTIFANAYFDRPPERVTVAANAQNTRHYWLRSSGHWYDFSVTIAELPGWWRRLAGRVETGRDSISDPAVSGQAVSNQVRMN